MPGKKKKKPTSELSDQKNAHQKSLSVLSFQLCVGATIVAILGLMCAVGHRLGMPIYKDTQSLCVGITEKAIEVKKQSRVGTVRESSGLSFATGRKYIPLII